MGTPSEKDKAQLDKWFVEVKRDKYPFTKDEYIPPLSFEDLIDEMRKLEKVKDKDESPKSETTEVADYHSFIEKRIGKNNSDEILKEIEQLSEVCRKMDESTGQLTENFFSQMALLYFAYWISKLNITEGIWRKFCVEEVVRDSTAFLMDEVSQKFPTLMDDQIFSDSLLTVSRLMVRGFKCVLEGLNPKFEVYLPLEHYGELEKYKNGITKVKAHKKNETERFRRLFLKRQGGLTIFCLLTVLEDGKVDWEEKDRIASWFLQYRNQDVIEALLTTQYIRYIRNEAIKKVHQDIEEEIQNKIPGYKEYKKKKGADNAFEAAQFKSFDSESGEETAQVTPPTEGFTERFTSFRPIGGDEISATGKDFSVPPDIESDNETEKAAIALRCLIYGTFKDTDIVRSVQDTLYDLIRNFSVAEWWKKSQNLNFFLMNEIKNQLRPIYRSGKGLKEWKKENRSKGTLKILEREEKHFRRVENIPKLSWEKFLACISSNIGRNSEKLPKLFQRLLRTESYRVDALTEIAESVCSETEKEVVISWLEEVANSRGDINDKQFHHRIAKKHRISPSNVRTTKCRGLRRLVPELQKPSF